jgi:hypothetical protein
MHKGKSDAKLASPTNSWVTSTWEPARCYVAFRPQFVSVRSARSVLLLDMPSCPRGGGRGSALLMMECCYPESGIDKDAAPMGVRWQ